jgi:hypothetical protein
LNETTGKWKTVQAGTSGSKPDSYLHRYAHEVGFSMSEEDNRDMDGNVAVSAAMQQIDEQASNLVANRIKSQADFECWVLTKGHGTGYHNFMGQLQQCFDSNGNLKTDREYPKVTFQPPSASVVAAWVMYLRNDRQLSHDTIDGLLAGLSAVNGQFAGTSIGRSNLKELMKNWDLHDNTTGRKKQAPAFDMRFDLPKIMCAVFSMLRYTDLARVTLWATILIMLSVMGRASCMSDYSPLIEHIEFPTECGGYDADGLPKVLYIPWTNWKGRKRGIGQKYFIAIPRNYTDPRFCPVFWLMKMLAMRKQLKLPLRGKLFPYAKSKPLQTKLKNVFKKAGMPKFSSHSVRRTAAQWAAQCGADLKTIMDVGRWVDINVVRKYVGQGQADHTRLVAETTDGKDPIGFVWFFRTYVRASGGCEYMRI